jgi:hypothetical protein
MGLARALQGTFVAIESGNLTTPKGKNSILWSGLNYKIEIT